MLDSVMRLVVGNTAMGGAKKPLDLMSEEELESELRRQVLEAAVQIQGKIEVVDAVRNMPVVVEDSGELSFGSVPKVPADRDVGPGRCMPPDSRQMDLRGIPGEEG